MPVLLFFLIFLGWAHPVWGETGLDVQFFTGYNSASLRTLNNKKLAETSFNPPALRGSPSIHDGPLIGLEVEWRIRPRFSLVAFVSSWEGESRTLESGETPFEDNGVIPFKSDRLTRVSFNEYALRGRYHILDSPKHHRLYLEFGLFDQVKVTYREDDNYVLQATAGETLRNISSRAVSKGGYLFEWGVGGDLYLNKWAAVSLNANYRIGKAVPLLYKSFRHTFTEQDAIADASGRTSPFPKTGEAVLVDRGTEAQQPLKIELDGFQVSAGIRIFF